jgi:hypothetical protein
MVAMHWVLWGQNPLYASGAPIRLACGNLGECRREQRFRVQDGGWTRLVILYGCEAWGQPAHGQPEHTCNAYSYADKRAPRTNTLRS